MRLMSWRCEFGSMAELDSHSAEESNTQRRGAYTRVGMQKFSFDYMNPAYLVYDGPWLITMDLSNLVGKVYNPCRVYFHSNITSTVMDS
jgi:hypothetical protein